MRLRTKVWMLAASLLLVCAFPALGAAEVRFTGNVDQIVVVAKNATISEILSDIESALEYKITLRGSTDRRFTGTYSGSVRRVLTRLLDGADYVVSSDRDQISIFLVGTDGRASTRNGPASGLQGWIGQPSELPVRAQPPVGTSLSAVANPEPANGSHVQGWAGQPSELPARPGSPAGTSLTAVASPEPANSSGDQGWTGQPSELPARARSTVGTSLTAMVNPEPANRSDVQGWTGQPSELALRADPR